MRAGNRLRRALAASAGLLFGFVSIVSAANEGELGLQDGWASAALLRADGTAGFDEGEPGWRSRLEFPVEGWLLELRGGARRPVAHGRHPAYFNLRGRYVASLSMEGHSSDFDWDGAGTLSDYSTSDCTADVRLWELKAGWSIVYEGGSGRRSTELGFHLGYGADWFDFSDANLRAVYDYGQTVYSLSGPSATYELLFRGVRLGGFVEVQPADRWSMRAELDWMPFLLAEAEALWILRDYPFEQEAEGQGLRLVVRGKWQPTHDWALIGGARLVRLIADQDGVESGVLDGMAYRDLPIVDELTSEYVALELGVARRF